MKAIETLGKLDKLIPTDDIVIEGDDWEEYINPFFISIVAPLIAGANETSLQAAVAIKLLTGYAYTLGIKRGKAEAMNKIVKVNPPAAEEYPEPTIERPSMEQIQDWVFDSTCEATDGCTVEPDGVCPHGHPSWLLKLGMI